MLWFRTKLGTNRLLAETLPLFSDRFLEDRGHRGFSLLGFGAKPPRGLFVRPKADSVVHILWPIEAYL